MSHIKLIRVSPPCYRDGGRKDRVLKFFQARVRQRVPLPEILQTFPDIAEPMRVIRYLRADGYDIPNEEEYVGRIVHSFYTFNGFFPLHIAEPPRRTAKEQKAWNDGYAAAKAQYTQHFIQP